MEAVVSMYEDCFDLCTFQSQLIEEPRKSQAENFSWWQKLAVRQSGSRSTPLRYALISHFSMPVKRTKELRALTGWLVTFSFTILHLHAWHIEVKISSMMGGACNLTCQPNFRDHFILLIYLFFLYLLIISLPDKINLGNIES